jgi:uncharacterized membrane protein
MEPLIVLITVFALGTLISRFRTGHWGLPFNGNLAMCCMLFLTAAGHFMFTKGMAMMIPPFIPFRTELVYITAFMEVLLGLALLSLKWRRRAGYVLIVFFVLILPANIYEAVIKLNMEKGTFDGAGLPYLWFRIPLQALFIGWVYYFSIRSKPAGHVTRPGEKRLDVSGLSVG